MGARAAPVAARHSELVPPGTGTLMAPHPVSPGLSHPFAGMGGAARTRWEPCCMGLAWGHAEAGARCVEGTDNGSSAGKAGDGWEGFCRGEGH